MRAWRVAESVAMRLSSPPTDVAAADGDVHAVIASSRLFHAADTTRSVVECAWASSGVRRLTDIVAAGLPDRGPGDRLRRSGACLTIAAITAFLLQFLGSGEDAPFRWILPLAFAVIGATMAVAAEPIARAWKDKHR